MMHHDSGGALLRLKQESRSQAHANIFFRLEQSKQLGLILQIRARRIAERISRSAILLMKQIANLRSVFPRNPQSLAHLLVMKLRQRLRRLYAQSVQIQVFRILAAFKQMLRLTEAFGPTVTSDSPITSLFP